MRRILITTRARAMRKSMTEPEVMLWSRLRGRGPDHPQFRRQHPFESIVLDFYCPAARLAVEVDGATHWDPSAQAKDEARDRWLASQGIEVMRIPASLVFRHLSGVARSVIGRALERTSEQSSARLAPSTTGSTLRSAGGPPPTAPRGR